MDDRVDMILPRLAKLERDVASLRAAVELAREGAGEREEGKPDMGRP